MSVANVRKTVEELGHCADLLGVMGAVLVAQRDNVSFHPDVARAIEDVLAVAGIQDTNFEKHESLDRVIGAVRSQLLQAAHMTDPKALEPGWWYTSREVLEAQGQGSSVTSWPRSIFPNAEGLERRLSSSGGAFLDVGVGVAGIAIAAATMWPALNVVGIDPWQPALEIAKENVAEARLNDRIELRCETAEALKDREAFDLIWLPAAFMPGATLQDILINLKQALKVDGWLMCTVRPMPEDALGQSLERLRSAMRGSLTPDMERIADMMRSVGYENVVILPGPPNVVLGCRLV